MKLVTLPEAFGLRNVSPFCLKVEMALTYLNLSFETETLALPQKAPKGKLPYLEVEGRKLPDSELIFQYLDDRTEGGLYGGLTPAEIGAGTAFVRLAEDHLYWLMVASRWLDDDWFINVQVGFFGAFPPVIRNIGGAFARRQMQKTLDLHGLGRHSLKEQKHFARCDLDAISQQVSAHGYIAGNRMTAFDFSVVGLLSGIYDQKPSGWITEIAEDFPAVKAYAEKVQAEVGVFGRPLY